MKSFSIIALVMAAACGGGSGGGLGSSDPITAAEAEPLCRGDCQRRVDCGSDSDVAACTTACVGDIAGWARGDGVEALLACMAELACDANDDACILEVSVLAIHQEWEDRCRATMVTCFTEPGELDAACGVTAPVPSDAAFFRLIAPEIMTELVACFDGADCTTRIDCVGAALEAHGIN